MTEQTDLTEAAKDAAVEVLPPDPGLDLDVRQAYVVSIDSATRTVTIRFPESTADIPGVRYLGDVPAVAATIWVLRRGPAHFVLGVQSSGIAPGTLAPFLGTTDPAGWLICDGRSISAGTYPQLHAITGNNIPDLRGRAVIGSGQGSGLTNRTHKSTGGAETVALTTAELPGHTHNIDHTHADTPQGNLTNTDQVAGTPIVARTSNNSTFTGNSGSTGSGSGHANMQPWYAAHWIIKW